MSKFIAMVILKPDIQKGQIDFIQSDITTIFEQNAKLEKVWFLGKRKLDYKIKKYTEGLYLKMEIKTRSKKIEEIKETLKRNQYVIFSIFINNDNKENNLPTLKKSYLPLPFKKIPTANKVEVNKNNKKVYMLISKNVKLPFAESDILAISEDNKKIFEIANKKLHEYIFIKGYHTTKDFKFIKNVEDELKRTWKADFTLGNNTNVSQQLLIQEKYLI